MLGSILRLRREEIQKRVRYVSALIVELWVKGTKYAKWRWANV